MNINSHLKRAWKEAKAAYADTNYQQSAELRRCLNLGYETYAREYLRITPTSDQLRISKAVETAPYRVLVPAANSVGKTYYMASYARYFYEKYNPSITLVTAVNSTTVKDAVFRELRTQKPKLYGFKPKATRVESAPDHYIHGFTAAKADGFQGRHELHMCGLFDESTGIDVEFMNRGKTMFYPQEGHAWICAYNPNDPSTWPYLEEELGGWHVIRLSALTHDNINAELCGLPAPIPSAVRLSSVLSRLESECEVVTEWNRLNDSERQLCFEFPAGTQLYWRPKTQAFEAQVLGRWPLLPTESILSPGQVEKCIGRMYPVSENWQLVIACDIARFGSDRTAIVVRRGPCALHVETWQKRDTVFVIERLKQLVAKFAQDEQERRECTIYVDDTGGYGGGVIDHMQGYNIHGLHMSSRSPNPNHTGNMRTHLWFNMADMILAYDKGGGIDMTRLSEDMLQQLKRELTTPRYRIDEVGRRKLEPKVHIKERLGHSPDIADAFAMAFYLGV